MGGRGRYAETKSKQITIDYMLDKEGIANIIKASANTIPKGVLDGTGMDGGSGGYVSPKLYKKCACCFKYSLPADSLNVKCPICGWIDDEFQNTHIDSTDGMNAMCLREYRKSYFGTQRK